MSINEFNNALREAVCLDFAHIPTDEALISYNFSERFNQRMEKLIRSQKKVYYSLVNTSFKRVAIICIVLLSIFTAACSVDTIREPIVRFVSEVYESFMHYTFSGDTSDEIENKYTLNWIPDGFEQTDSIETDQLVYYEFKNAQGDIIEFDQRITESADIFIDNKSGNITEEEIGGKTVLIYQGNDTIQARWTFEKNYFIISTYGNQDIETVKHIIEKIE